MDVFIVIIAIVLLLIGLIGSFIPVIPGPPFCFISILILHYFTIYNFNSNSLLFWGFIVLIVFLMDYFLQIYGVKKLGGKQKAINGTFIGLILGVLTPVPFAFIIGPFLGAFLGAYLDERNNFRKIIKIAFGSILGLFAGSILKIILSCYLIFQFFKMLING